MRNAYRWYCTDIIAQDNVCLAGVPCHFGTDVFTDWVPKTDATVVTRILKAGGTV